MQPLLVLVIGVCLGQKSRIKLRAINPLPVQEAYDNFGHQPSDNHDFRAPGPLVGLNSDDGRGPLSSGPMFRSPGRFTSESENVSTFPGSEADAYRIVNYATLTYCNAREIERMRCKPCRRVSDSAEVIDIIPEPRFQGRAVLLLDNTRGYIILSFRGTIKFMNYITDLKMNMVPVPYTSATMVHAGFKEATDAILPAVIGPLTKLLNQFPQYRLIMTGHSLGGSMAVIAAADFAQKGIVPWERMAIFTYGEPRTGNLEFARFINQQRTIVTRVVNENDMVPHITRPSMGYVHHATELYIKNNRTTTCSTKELEDKQCSLTRFPVVSIVSHNQAWDLTLGPYGC